MSDTIESDQVFTPPEIFDGLGLQFDLDVASPRGGVSWIPACEFFTQDDDGLVKPWHGCVWMNPPYSKPDPWVRKWILHANGVCLLPFSKAKWFSLLWCNREVRMVSLCPRFRFVRSDRPHGIYMPTFVAAIGRKPHKAIERLADRMQTQVR